jgi:hypothetical protein
MKGCAQFAGHERGGWGLSRRPLAGGRSDQHSRAACWYMSLMGPPKSVSMCICHTVYRTTLD